MAETSAISSKGQVTVPVEVRRRLGLRAGDRVEFVLKGGEAKLRPVRSEGNPFAEWVGAARGFGSRQEAVEWVRELRDEESE